MNTDTLNIIIKPTNGCNMCCRYCYNRPQSGDDVILPLEYVNKLLDMASDTYGTLSIYWHGGEPLLCGVDYMRSAMRTMREIFLKKGTLFRNSVQTNGTLITPRWVSFFKKYGFTVGVSYDCEDHSRYRGYADKVLSRIKLLKSSGVKVACLSVAADDECDVLARYRQFRSLGVPFDLAPLFCEGGAKNMPPLSADNYVKKLTGLFHTWLYDKKGVDVRIFSEFIAMIMGNGKRVCTHGSCHGKWLCLSPDGTLTNCGRTDIGAYKFAHVNDCDKISDAFSGEGFLSLLRCAIDRREKCKSCEYFTFCQGSCSDCAIAESGSAQDKPVFSCALFRGLFPAVESEFRSVLNRKIPLSELNPAVREIAMACMGE